VFITLNPPEVLCDYRHASPGVSITTAASESADLTSPRLELMEPRRADLRFSH
jgi:hypothetical protein